MDKVAYMSLDEHAGNSVLGTMDAQGVFKGNQTFQTSEQNLIRAIAAVKARAKHLALEESTLAAWAARVARPHVTELIVADPRENALISRSANKRDQQDTQNLCRLLRLGELKGVYHAEEDERAIFKAAVQQYLDLRQQQVKLKHKLKAMYRHWGVVQVKGQTVYAIKGREKYLRQVSQAVIRNQLRRLYAILDATEAMQATALQEMHRLGRRYAEIREFDKIPGVGPVGASVFDAFVQTPQRFADKHRLWRYCRLGVTERSSDGKPLGYKRLDKNGVGALKAMSYWAWMTAMKKDNEVRRFYYQSLQRTHNHVHARLNTQRKIIAAMYGMWKKGENYSAEKFLGSSC